MNRKRSNPEREVPRASSEGLSASAQREPPPARAQRREPGLGPIVPALIDRGIRVTSPAAGQTFIAGQEFDVRYEVSRGEPPRSVMINLCYQRPPPHGPTCPGLIYPVYDHDLDGYVRVDPPGFRPSYSVTGARRAADLVIDVVLSHRLFHRDARGFLQGLRIVYHHRAVKIPDAE